MGDTTSCPNDYLEEEEDLQIAVYVSLDNSAITRNSPQSRCIDSISEKFVEECPNVSIPRFSSYYDK